VSLLLYINGQLADLDAGQTIAQTKQVNDLNSLDNRQASYTNKFKLPKTATNVKIMDYLTVTGNSSNIPYQKNECSLFNSTGECFVYKGWAVITDGGADYDAVIYDGIIDLYKAIENKNLASLVLDELTHEKTISMVRSTWLNYLTNPEETKFLYILADYNGNTGLTNITEDNPVPQVNIDYLVPSVNVKWLWDKIFSTHNFTATGSVFNTQSFKNLWMTFPKAQSVQGNNDHTIFHSTNFNFFTTTYNGPYRAQFITADVNELSQNQNNIYFKVVDAGTYKIQVQGKLFGRRFEDQEKSSRIRIAKNAEAWNNSQTTYNVNVKSMFYQYPDQYFNGQADAVPFAEDFDHTTQIFQLQALETVSVFISGIYEDEAYTLLSSDENQLEVSLIRVDPNVLDFGKAFTDFSIKDFLNEVVHRFGLTMFTNKYNKECEFLTLQEQLQTPYVLNWSSKFDKKISENYIYGNYAQNNWFRYNYNDKESTHNDNYLTVNNVNLPDSKDIIKSKIYSPERIKSTYLGNTTAQQNTNVYKLWDKEVIENPEPDEAPVKYKPLDKRYYFMRAQSYLAPINVYSETLGQPQLTGISFRENYNNLSFNDIHNDYYGPLQDILKEALIVKAQLWLNEADVAGLDFKKLVYIEQLSNYFILNKVDGYIPGKSTKCELVRVQYTLPDTPNSNFILNSINITGINQISLNYTQNITGIAGMLQISTNNISWTNFGYITINPYTTYTMQPGSYYFRISCLGYSNVLSINIPS